MQISREGSASGIFRNVDLPVRFGQFFYVSKNRAFKFPATFHRLYVCSLFLLFFFLLCCLPVSLFVDMFKMRCLLCFMS